MSTTRSGSDIMTAVERKLANPKTKRSKTIPDGVWDRLVEEVDESLRARDFSMLTARHFVALYALMHNRTYGLPASELTPGARLKAAFMAAALLEREFGGDRVQMAEWMRWAWTRERGRAAFREANGRPPSRIGWYFMFAGALVTDWRLERMQGGAPRR